MNLLITGAWHDAKLYIKKIEDMGHSVSFLQYEKDTLPCDYEWVEGIIGNGIFLHHSIDQFTNLKFIQLTSAGYDRVPMVYTVFQWRNLPYLEFYSYISNRDFFMKIKNHINGLNIEDYWNYTERLFV